MCTSRLLGALFGVVSTLFSITSPATLIGVLPATPNGTDYQAYYDTARQINDISG